MRNAGALSALSMTQDDLASAGWRDEMIARGASGNEELARRLVAEGLAGRAAFYSKADLRVDTSRQPLVETFRLLRAEVRQALGLLV